MSLFVSAAAIAAALGPLMRTTPIPPRPTGVAIATIVSSTANMMAKNDQRRCEMMTVFMNASPMLSDVICASSATVR